MDKNIRRKIPFERYVSALLFFNKDIPFIVNNLSTFRYKASDEEVGSIFSSIRQILPESLSTLLKEKGRMNPSDETHRQWLEHFGIYEIYDYFLNKDKAKDHPDYFKWCEDCIWIHKYEDVMTLVNIFMFNGDPFEDISKVISFKYRKKIGVEALKLYKSVFWDCDEITSKDALYFCLPFRENAIILKKLRSGGSEFISMSVDADSDDGTDMPVVFNDSDYIKWKIGYRDIKVPNARDFIEKVMVDSMFKYQEAMSMVRSVESEEASGVNEKIGEFSSNTKRYRNVEDQRAKHAKHWFDMFLKAASSRPPDEKEKESFFDKMSKLELEFDDDGKIARVDDIPDMLGDIKGDMNG